MKSGIYKITNISNNKFYIGSSINIDRREKEHLRNLKANKHTNLHLQYSWNKYKENNFTFETLENCNIDDLITREQYYIDQFKPHYNICKIAGSTLGFKPTIEQINKATLKRIGSKRSYETRKKMSEWQLGRKFSEESKSKMSQSAKTKSNMDSLINRMKDRDAKGSNNGRAILNENQVRLIKIDINNGVKSRDIITEYKINRSILYYIRSGKTWKHVII